MNKSAYTILPSALKIVEGEEEELDALMTQRKQIIEDKSIMKNRWFSHVEKEDVRTKEKSLEALNRASSCQDAVEATLNKADAYAEYKNLENKMKENLLKKINNIE